MRPSGFSTLGAPELGARAMVELARRHQQSMIELRLPTAATRDAAAADAVARVSRTTARAGIGILSLASYVALAAEPHSSSADAEVVANLVHLLRLADRVGARGVRVFMHDIIATERDPLAGPTAGERVAARRLREALTMAGDVAAQVLIETHDSHGSAARLARFLRFADTRRVGVIWDTAHTWSGGEDFDVSRREIGPWLSHIQVKDVRSAGDPTPVPLGMGGFPVQHLAASLVDWIGPVILEWERAWHPDLPALDDALRTWREWGSPLFEGE